MNYGTKKKLGPSNEPIEPNKTHQKRKYSPPRFEVLTADQAKVRLTERAVHGEPETEHLLAAVSRPRPGTGE